MSSLLTKTFRAGMRMVPIGAIARAYRPVLNYHACFVKPPASVAPIDNVSPEWLYRHLSELQKIYRFVPIDEFCESAARDIAALTFDDGYKSAIEAGLGVCETLNIPMAVFLNTRSLERVPFWRHKVTYVAENGLAAECEQSFRQVRKVNGLDFYAYLKHPVNCSPVVEAEVDAFLRSKGLDPGPLPYLADGEALYRHRLITYGNHTHNHYVLSSLTRSQQQQEIETTHRILGSIPGLQISRVFSLPFGQVMHINSDTFSITRELGYKAVLLNRGGLNPMSNPVPHSTLPVIERFSPEPFDIFDQVKREAIRTAGSPGWRDPLDQNGNVR